MNRRTKTLIFFLVCAVMAIPAHQSASACQVDEFYHTKDGALAASTQEVLNAAIRFEEEGNKEKLAGLMKNGTVLRLTGNIKVQVLERSVEFKTLKITFPDERGPYWVKDGSLKQINSNELLP
jgi:hypothetical protein